MRNIYEFRRAKFIFVNVNIFLDAKPRGPYTYPCEPEKTPDAKQGSKTMTVVFSSVEKAFQWIHVTPIDDTHILTGIIWGKDGSMSLVFIAKQ